MSIKMSKFALTWFLLIFLATWSYALVEKNDEIFQELLNRAMEAYPKWLTEQNLNPFAAPPRNLVLESQNTSKLSINCVFTTQKLSENSTIANQAFESWSNFAGHEFGIKRIVREPYLLSGNYSCTGRLNEPEEEQFSFSGFGSYTQHAETSIEVVTVRHVGVTPDYKLDLKLAKYDSERHLSFTGNIFEGGIWNDSRADKTIPAILKEFTFSLYLTSDLDQGEKEPRLQLLMITKYIMDKTKDFDLNSNMDESELPTPYSPSQSTTTDSPTSEDTSTSNTQADVSTATSLANKLVSNAVGTIVALVLLMLIIY